MKKVTLTLCSLLIISTAFAQLRLIGYNKYEHTGLMNYPYRSIDSAAISYAPTNKNVGGVNDFNVTDLTENLKFTECFYREGTNLNHRPRYKITKKYNAQWQVIEVIQAMPYHVNGPLVNSFIEQYQYDAKGNRIGMLAIRWNNLISQWDSIARGTTTYDANGNILVYEDGLFLNNQSFIKNNRLTYTYDINNNLTTYLVEYRNANFTGYDSSTRFFYTYDAGGNVDTVTAQIYTTNPKQWQNQSRQIYTYNNGQLTELLTQSWQNNMWEDQKKEETFYNTPFYGTYTDYSVVMNNNWVYRTRKSTITLSTNPRVEDETEWNWTPNTPPYLPLKRVVKTYNSEDYLAHAVTSMWDNNKREWIYGKGTDSTIYWYEDISTLSTNNISNNAPTISVYPNPSSSYINVAVANTNNSPYTIAIYSIDGRLMTQQNVTNGAAQKTIPTAHLSNGQYILTITTKEGKTTKQFSVLR